MKDLEDSLKKEGKMLREIGFKVCGHRICMIEAPNVCGICGKKYKIADKKLIAKKSKYIESDSESDKESDEESDKESDEEVAPVSKRASLKRKLVVKQSLSKNMVISIMEFYTF